MNRSPVFKYIEDIPMEIHTQREPDGTWVAVLPAWKLVEVLVTRGTEASAIAALKNKLNVAWGVENKEPEDAA